MGPALGLFWWAVAAFHHQETLDSLQKLGPDWTVTVAKASSCYPPPPCASHPVGEAATLSLPAQRCVLIF